MNIGILTIGDEILIGQIANTNAAWIGQAFLQRGLQVASQRVIGDDRAVISRTLLEMLAQHDVVIVTGGLGPTHDDVTVEAIAAALNTKLIEDHDWLQKMESYFQSKNRTMSSNNKKQALRLEGSERIDNDCGTAPGMWITHQNKSIIVLPGVPYEMQSMMERVVLPKFSKFKAASKKFMWNIYTTGIGESVLAQKFDDIEPVSSFLNQSFELAWLPSPQGVKLRLLIQANSLEEAEKHQKVFLEKYDAALKPYLLGVTETNEEIKIETVLGNILKESNKTLALAESCTGGLVTSRLTDISGSSKYILGAVVSYHRSIKEQFLDVPDTLINKHGEVSEQVARAMAEGVRKGMSSDYGVGVTGIAGPTGATEDKPVGLVWIAVSDATHTLARQFIFEKDRMRNKLRFSQAALDFLRKFIQRID